MSEDFNVEEVASQLASGILRLASSVFALAEEIDVLRFERDMPPQASERIQRCMDAKEEMTGSGG